MFFSVQTQGLFVFSEIVQYKSILKCCHFLQPFEFFAAITVIDQMLCESAATPFHLVGLWNRGYSFNLTAASFLPLLLHECESNYWIVSACLRAWLPSHSQE